MATFPDGKRFAFTVFDDADLGTVENLAPLYRLLEELGLRTTRSVWPLTGSGALGGQTLEHRPYADFILDLRSRGFEIALHGVQDGSATRPRTEEGLAVYRAVLGEYPRLNTSHSRNRENIYWGADRIGSPPLRLGYRVLSSLRRRRERYEGHQRGSPYFWGDLCAERITYARNFVFDEINLDRVNPSMPYHDPRRPFIRQWFSSSNGPDMVSFSTLLREPNQERLEDEGGVCIMYTHFACGFVEDGRVNPRFADLLRRLAGRPGWFVPVGTLLDHLREQRGGVIAPQELARMERTWFAQRLLGASRPGLRDNQRRGQRPAHPSA